MFGALKDKKGGKHGDIILNRNPYKCKKTWDSDITEDEIQHAQEAIDKYGGHFDTGAVTKWYKLDKDIKIFHEKSKTSYPLSFKSKLINVMPGLPKTTRLYINQEEGWANYEFTI